MAGARFRTELIRLTARRGVLHLLPFGLRRYGLNRLAVPRQRVQPCAALSALFSQVIQYGRGGEREHLRRAVFHAGRALRPFQTEVAFVRRGLYAVVFQRGDQHVHRAKRTGHHAGFTANAFLLIDLYAVAVLRDGPVRAALHTGRVFTVVAGHGAFSQARGKDRNAGMKMALAQHVLFPIVRHHTATSQRDNRYTAEHWP